jgi:hypothetical protein
VVEKGSAGVMLGHPVLVGAVMNILEDSGPRARRGISVQGSAYLEVRLPDPVPQARQAAPPPLARPRRRPAAAPEDAVDLGP